MTSLNYNYSVSKEYCESLGLIWLGEDFIRAADTDAKSLGFTQEQVDTAMRHHLWQVRFLFDPKSYVWYARIGMAYHFLFGKMKK